MWQHKQEERELKRSEGDIIKSQHMLRRTMKDFEIGENSDSGPIQIFHKLPFENTYRCGRKSLVGKTHTAGLRLKNPILI